MQEARIAVVVVLVVLVVCVAGILGVLIFRPQLLTPPVAAAEGPAILIDSPRHGDEVLVGQPVRIFATGYDAGKIERMQLWVDGGMVVSQASALAEGMNPFPLLATWVPETLGNHTIVVRGYNVSGVPGQATITVFGVEGPEIPREMPAEGCAGVLLIAHQVQEGETLEEIALQYGVTEEELLACNPGLDPLALPAPGDTVMVPFLAAPEEEESGPPGGELPVVEPSEDVEEGPGQELPLVEQEPQQGEEGPSDVLEGPETQEGVEVQGLEEPRAVLSVEAQTLYVDQPYAAGYCLVRLGEGDMEWVPGGGDLFVGSPGPYSWDIAAELGGVENSRTVPVYGETLHAEIHCYAFADVQDPEPISLGEISREHTELDWTGEQLEATSEGGDEGHWFTLTYRICPVTCYPERELPAPYYVGYGRQEGAPYLFWQWDGDSSTIDGFSLYRNGSWVRSMPAEDRQTLLFMWDSVPPCGETYRYQVSAYRGPLGHGIESPLSVPFELPPSGPLPCARRVTLTVKEVDTKCIRADCPHPEPDCSNCRLYFWYGGISANTEFLYNEPPIVSDGALTWAGPVLDSHKTYRGRDLFLDRDTLVVDLAEGEDLLIMMVLMDWDTDGLAQTICSGSSLWTPDDLVEWEHREEPALLGFLCWGQPPEVGLSVQFLCGMEVETFGP